MEIQKILRVKRKGHSFQNLQSRWQVKKTNVTAQDDNIVEKEVYANGQ